MPDSKSRSAVSGMDSTSTPTGFKRFPLLAGSLLGGVAVILGAFGAHALKPALEARDMFQTWNTAVHYQFFHALALVALASFTLRSRLLCATACAWVIGVLLFSGSLYLLSFGGPKWLGPITPIGGLSFIVGWALLAWQALITPRT